jgi:cytochrome P450
MPWTLHRHELYWDKPRAFMPERFLPENRGKLGRFQYPAVRRRPAHLRSARRASRFCRKR